MFLCFNNYDRCADGCNWRFGVTFWLHSWLERCCHSDCICRVGHLSARYFDYLINVTSTPDCLLLKNCSYIFADTFASKVAAQNDKYADSSIGNVTGSNAVNVFLGIGIAWTLAAIVHAFKGTEFLVDPGNLAYSVTLYCITAFLCSAVLLLRRQLGGELGGPMRFKLPTTILFVSFWLFYVLMSSLEAYDIIPGF